MELTLCKALEISIKKWEAIYDDPTNIRIIVGIMREIDIYNFDCPLCHIYLKYTFPNHYEHINKECPLYEEYHHKYDNLCCKDFHRFANMCEKGHYRIAKKYALRILNKLKTKLKELEINEAN